MTWMVYGANGYTGRLIAELAVARDGATGGGDRPLERLDRVLGLRGHLRLSPQASCAFAADSGSPRSVSTGTSDGAMVEAP